LAVGSIDSNDFFVQCGTHNHPANEKLLVRSQITECIKNTVETKGFSNMKIVTDATKNLSDDTIVDIQKFKSLLDKCRRIKNAKYADYNSKFDDIPIFLQRDLQSQQFLQFDKGAGSLNRFLILFSNRNINYLETVETVLVDGTFWSVPSDFTQLITFNCFLFGKYYPLCFIIMNSKTQVSYIEAFSKLNELVKCKFNT
jgi:hypothetical protein